MSEDTECGRSKVADGGISNQFSRRKRNGWAKQRRLKGAGSLTVTFVGRKAISRPNPVKTAITSCDSADCHGWTTFAVFGFSRASGRGGSNAPRG